MRTAFGRPRPRRFGAVLALLLVAASASIAANGLASASTSSGAAARLVFKQRNPATVSGTGFKPRTRIWVTFVGTQTVAPARGGLSGSVHGDIPDRCRPLHGVVRDGTPAGPCDGHPARTRQADVRPGVDAVAVAQTSAEGAGFEPAVRLHGLWFSRPAHSTALPPLRESPARC